MKTFIHHSESGESRILLKRGLLGEIGTVLKEEGLPSPKTFVSNTTVGPLYGDRVARILEHEFRVELEDGESFKNWESIESIVRAMLERGVHRGDVLLGLGGGVVTDLAGFAASIYMRGIRWIAIPTTLLAMVDASVGGKTGMNLDLGKNLIGSFWTPRLVLIDPELLRSLPERELLSGAVEVLKAGWIGDEGIMEILSGGIPSRPGEMDELIARALRVKLEIVRKDEREGGARKALNLGHTLGHALESLTSYGVFRHGEAVGWGMRCAAWISHRRGLLSEEDYRQKAASIDALGELPPITDLEPGKILEHLFRDKKRDASGIAWVLPTAEGVLLDQRVANSEILEFLRNPA